MAIPESHLDTWAKQGSVTQSSTTYATIKGALEATSANYAAKNFEVFLQGSYGNDTNIYAESDVDVVIRLDSIFHYNLDDLTPTEKAAFESAHSGGAAYSYASFKSDVKGALGSKFGSDVKDSKNAVKVKANGSRRNADVLVATEFRQYQNFFSISNQRYMAGVCFFTSAGNRIVNYPKQHSVNCTAKHQASNSWFKPMIRIYKNARGKLVNDGAIDQTTAPSYFIEGLLYNVPNYLFTGTYGDAFVASFKWILQADRSKFVTVNEQYPLLGDSAVTWPAANCNLFLDTLAKLWNNW